MTSTHSTHLARWLSSFEIPVGVDNAHSMFYVFFKYDTETMFFLNCTPVRLLSCHNRRLQGCQIFFADYGQKPDKNSQNDSFLKKLWPKSQSVLTMIISS